jgi:hypothetical protein
MGTTKETLALSEQRIEWVEQFLQNAEAER